MTWEQIKLLDDVRQRAHVLDAAKAVLNATVCGTVLTTGQVAKLVGGDDVSAIRDVSRILVRLATKGYFKGFATHDGEEYIRFGRANVRYRWHGQQSKPKEEWEQ